MSAFTDDAAAEAMVPAGGFFGDVLPARPSPPLPNTDARDVALTRLVEFISLLAFKRRGNTPEQSIGFSIPIANIHRYQPDDIVNLPLPGIGILPGKGNHLPFGLGPAQLVDSSQDKFGPGTALLNQSELVEQIILEVWAEKHSHRRAIVAGLNRVFRLFEASYALRLTLPAYYGQVAQFTLLDTQYIEDDAAVRNRRRAHLFVEMRVCEVALVNYVTLRPSADVFVLSGNTTLELEC